MDEALARTVITRPALLGVTVGITNARLSAVKRHLAVDSAMQLAEETNADVCLLGADPTDHDVQRRMPDLIRGKYRRMELRHGPYSVEVAYLEDRHLTIVTLSDRAVIESVLSRLQDTFGFIVIDAPSQVSSRGVGIARVLLPFLDALVVASGIHAGDLALTQAYIDALATMPAARHLRVRVALAGSSNDSGLSREQLRRKLGRLPVFEPWNGDAPNVTQHAGPVSKPLDRRVEQLVEWMIGLGNARPDPRTARMPIPQLSHGTFELRRSSEQP